MTINLTEAEKFTLSQLLHEYSSCDIALQVLEEKLKQLEKEKQNIIEKILRISIDQEKKFVDSLKDKYGIGELDVENYSYHVK